MTLSNILRAACVVVALCVAPSGLGAAPEKQEPGPQLRVYEVGDLPSFIPPGAKSQPEPKPVNAADHIAQQLGLKPIELGPGLIAIEADSDRQDVYAKALDALRAAYGERVAVRIAARMLEADQQPRVGDVLPKPGAPPLREVQQVVYRKRPSRLEAVRVETYVATQNSVVGTGAVAFNPAIEDLRQGLSMAVCVGPDAKGRSVVRLSGSISTARFEPQQVGGAATLKTEATVQLPRIEQREVESAVSVGANEEIIFAVVPAPGDDAKLLALTVSLWPVQP